MRRSFFVVHCALKRIVAVLVFLPIGLITFPYLLIRRRTDLSGFISLFSAREWNKMIGNGPEIATAPFRVVDSKYPNKLDELPLDCWYHPASRTIACRSFDDAVLVLLKYDGKIKRN